MLFLMRWTMQVWTTVSGNTALIASGKPLSPSRPSLRRLRKLACNGNQDIGHAAVLELVHDPHPELRALGLLDPYPEDFLGAIRQDAERDVNRLVAHEALIPDLDRIASKNTSG